jgi:hypothetical protein
MEELENTIVELEFTLKEISILAQVTAQLPINAGLPLFQKFQQELQNAQADFQTKQLAAETKTALDTREVPMPMPRVERD